MNEKELLSRWGMTFAGEGDRTLITGSPNRTERRFLFRDGKGVFHIAEGYALRKQSSQIRQNLLLEFLAEHGLPGIHPFLRTISGEHGEVSDALFWQIRPYIPAEAVPRETLGNRPEYALLWGDFLLQMKDILQHSSTPPPMPNPPFFMADFLPRLRNLVRNEMPSIMEELDKFEELLVPFFKWERKADGMFAHGDFHPGNLLMGEGGIRGVIDWEFAGVKFPGYDMALLMGCLAMDDPENLVSPTVLTLRDHLFEKGYLPEDAWDLLPQMVAAARLGWLGEWLTLKEESLVRQELALLSLLLEV
ncbi:MAG: aminoglycoside phosphotransferase family protein [Lentisphaeria bacterium]|nr:aminoglycoside phosphotransferase family protein [Lentisphaeria bacterium]